MNRLTLRSRLVADKELGSRILESLQRVGFSVIREDS